MIKYKMDLRNSVKRLKLCLRADSRVSESTPAVSESTPEFQSRLPQRLQHCMSCDTLPSRLPTLPSRLPQSKTVQIISMRSSRADSTSVGVVSQVWESSPQELEPSPSGHHRSWKSAVYYEESSPLSAESSPKSGSRLLKNWSRLQKSKIKL